MGGSVKNGGAEGKLRMEYMGKRLDCARVISVSVGSMRFEARGTLEGRGPTISTFRGVLVFGDHRI